MIDFSLKNRSKITINQCKGSMIGIFLPVVKVLKIDQYVLVLAVELISFAPNFICYSNFVLWIRFKSAIVKF